MRNGQSAMNTEEQHEKESISRKHEWQARSALIPLHTTALTPSLPPSVFPEKTST